MITKIPHDYYIQEKMKEDPVTCDIIALHNSNQSVRKADEMGIKAPISIKINKGDENVDLIKERYDIMCAFYKSEITTEEMWAKIEELNKKEELIK